MRKLLQYIHVFTERQDREGFKRLVNAAGPQLPPSHLVHPTSVHSDMSLNASSISSQKFLNKIGDR